MRKKIATIAAIGALSVTGLVGAAVVAPAFAASGTGAATVADRLTAIKDALKGLVSDGTLTQDQADKVASTLDEKLPMRGPGHGWFGVDAAADAIGIDESDLMTQLRDGKTLAEIAEANGVAKDTLIDKLVTAGEQRLATAVTDGRLTQAQADEIKAGLRDRITEFVDRSGPVGGRGRGGWGGGRVGQAPHDGTDPATPTPTSPSSSSSGTSATTPTRTVAV